MVTATLIGIGILALGWMVLYAGVVQRRAKMLIEDTPTSTVRSISMGQVEVKGTPEPFEEPHEAPFSKEDCVLYRYHVDQWFNGGQNSSGDWAVRELGTRPSTFYLDDGTGRVLVDPSGAEVDVTRNTYELDAGEDEPEAIRSFLAGREDRFERNDDMPTLGNSVSTFLGERERRLGHADELVGNTQKKRRYVEEYLPVGEDVYVFGYASSREGVSSPDNPENVVIGNHDDLPTFRIYDGTETDLVEETGSNVFWTFVGGVFVATMGVVWLLVTAGGIVGLILTITISPLSIALAMGINRVIDLGKIRVGERD